ncbi:hypothetical protein KY343_05395 [Candidatus Woesearchaeota archaeon]|nr:hypothetical protein [Candidatus Woesearchaeota archaeon]
MDAHDEHNHLRIRSIVEEIGRHYEEKGLADPVIIKRDAAIHAFYRLKEDPSKVAYVNAYPSTDKLMGTFILFQDYDPNFPVIDSGTINNHQFLGYKAEYLEHLIGRKIPQLRLE